MCIFVYILYTVYIYIYLCVYREREKTYIHTYLRTYMHIANGTKHEMLLARKHGIPSARRKQKLVISTSSANKWGEQCNC